MPAALNMDPGLIGVSTKAFAITPHNSTNHTTPARYIYVGVGGDVALVNLDDTVVVYKNVPTGAYIMCANKRVNATSTNATDLVGHV